MSCPSKDSSDCLGWNCCTACRKRIIRCASPGTRSTRLLACSSGSEFSGSQLPPVHRRRRRRCSLPLDNVDAEVNTASLAYARTFGLFGRSASIGFVLPYSRADVSGDVFEQQRAVTRTGLADPRLRLAVNSYRRAGAQSGRVRRPRALHHTGCQPHGRGGFREILFRQAEQSRVERWAFKPEIGALQPLGPWSLELYAGALAVHPAKPTAAT